MEKVGYRVVGNVFIGLTYFVCDRQRRRHGRIRKVSAVLVAMRHLGYHEIGVMWLVGYVTLSETYLGGGTLAV